MNHEVRITQLLSSKDISGAIIAPVVTSSSEIDHLFRLKMINFPFVLLEAVQGIQANVVSIDNIKTMKDAVKHDDRDSCCTNYDFTDDDCCAA